jgi:hypothetical protein
MPASTRCANCTPRSTSRVNTALDSLGSARIPRPGDRGYLEPEGAGCCCQAKASGVSAVRSMAGSTVE